MDPLSDPPPDPWIAPEGHARTPTGRPSPAGHGPLPGALLRDRRAWSIAVLLALASMAAFLPVLNNGFVSYDDDENFVANDAYRGLGWPQLEWAWTAYHVGVYQPVGWMILGAEYDAFGMDPRGYHLT